MRRPLIIMLCCFLAGALIFTLGTVEPSGTSAKQPAQTYLLLLDNDTGAFLMQLRKGMEEAAQALGARLDVMVMLPGDALPELKGYTNLLLYMQEPEALVDRLRALGVSSPITISEGEDALVSPDFLQGDRLLCACAAKAAKGGQIALVLPKGEGGEALLEKRLEAITQALSGTHYRVTDTPDAGDAVLLALSPDLISHLAKAWPDKPLYGYAPGEEARISLLESGQVEALAAVNPYAMGYSALLTAAAPRPEKLDIPFKLIDLTSMYLPENVKIVFPLL